MIETIDTAIGFGRAADAMREIDYQAVQLRQEPKTEVADSSAAAQGAPEDRAWVAENVPALALTHSTTQALRRAFWQAWLKWRERGAQLVADCAWPVEAGFLSACVRDVGALAHWQGPYPLYDISSMEAALGMRSPERQANELPLHDPMNDVRHVVRRLLALKVMGLASTPSSSP